MDCGGEPASGCEKLAAPAAVQHPGRERPFRQEVLDSPVRLVRPCRPSKAGGAPPKEAESLWGMALEDLQHDPMEQVVSALVKQQSVLQCIAQQQEELREMLQQQSEALDQKFADLMQGAVPTPVSSESPVLSAAVAEKEEEAVTIEVDAAPASRVHSHHKMFASTASVPGAEAPEDKEQKMASAWVKRAMESHVFDVVVGALILLNFAVFFAELELKGHAAGHKLGLNGGGIEWSEVHGGFLLTEQCFCVAYILELALRLFLLGGSYFRDWLNVCDASVILISTVDSFIITPVADFKSDSIKSLSLLRIVRISRALRVLRFLRLLRVVAVFSALRVLVRTIRMSVDSLMWSMVLVALIILSAAMFLVQMNLGVLEDVDRDKALRDWIYMHYGTAGRASYTMFEATFSAKWATHLARPLIEDVSPWFSLFWILYTVIVNFAIIRVIAALFLKQTMAVAAIDAERMAVENMKAREKIVVTLHEIFRLGDSTSDGTIDRSEFKIMMKNPQVLKQFERLELEFNEVWMLFELLCEDDGVADADEFLCGCMRLKTNAKTVDMIHLMHQQVVTKRSIDALTRGVEQINTVLHPSGLCKAPPKRGSAGAGARQHVTEAG